MKTIIKLRGKILDIATINPSSVNVQMICYRATVRQNEQWQDLPTKFGLPQIICLTYQGPAHLSHKEVEEFALSSETVQSTYGVGVEIGNLFNNDDIEVYISCNIHADDSNKEHISLERTIISPLTRRPKDLLTFIREIKFSTD